MFMTMICYNYASVYLHTIVLRHYMVYGKVIWHKDNSDVYSITK